MVEEWLINDEVGVD